ncbi:hypothetical protein QBC44DRAFT_374383 [Cladorrhinum sp. PSN332]|nr:hypothetical protein QBC44DRAFT_374383 [Cladorrhinum sp. PSN332]
MVAPQFRNIPWAAPTPSFLSIQATSLGVQGTTVCLFLAVIYSATIGTLLPYDPCHVRALCWFFETDDLAKIGRAKRVAAWWVLHHIVYLPFDIVVLSVLIPWAPAEL